MLSETHIGTCVHTCAHPCRSSCLRATSLFSPPFPAHPPDLLGSPSTHDLPSSCRRPGLKLPECSLGSSSPAGHPHLPSPGRGHLHLASLEGSGEAGRAGGAEGLRGAPAFIPAVTWPVYCLGLQLSPVPPGHSSLALTTPRGSLARYTLTGLGRLTIRG